MSDKPYKIFHVDEGLTAVIYPEAEIDSNAGAVVHDGKVTHSIFRASRELIRPGYLNLIIPDTGRLVCMPFHAAVPLDVYIQKKQEMMIEMGSSIDISLMESVLDGLKEVQKNIKDVRSGHLPVNDFKPWNDEKGSRKDNHAR